MDQEGYNRPGLDRRGLDKQGLEQLGFDQGGFETQDHISIEDADSNSSEEMQMDSNDDTFRDIEIEPHDDPHDANNLDKVPRNGLDKETSANELHFGLDGVLVPKVGMMFATVEEAYDYYNHYARMLGFSVRKQRTNKSRTDPSKVNLQTLCCSCEGFYNMVKPPKKKRKEKRFGCKAMFEINLSGENNYILVKFIAEHNHKLAPPETSHTLRSQRKFKPSSAGVMNKVQSSIVQQSEIFSHVFAEANRSQSLSTNHSRCNNVVENTSDKFIKSSDAQSLLDYFKKKRENKHFFYSFQTDEDYKICGVFFCDAKSRRDYGLFGDAVCFDTTFRTKDNMICILILGINNHGHNILFGCAMLNGETIDALVWLCSTFSQTMGGKKPITVFTNQSMSMMNAISNVFPDTHHKSYPWYIYQKSIKQLAQVSGKVKSFAQRLKECIYDSDTVEEFEMKWDLFLEEFGLRDNEWLQGLYETRQTWAQVYGHGYFCAGLTTSQRSESINKFLRTFFGSPLTLREFIDQYAKAMVSQREKEKEAENEKQQRFPNLLSSWSIELEAAQKYTNNMFYSFQREYKLTLDERLQLEKDDGATRTYRVTEMEGRRRSHTLIYNQLDPSVLCTCRKFELHGILCSHALKLLRDLEHINLPTQYYLKRWTEGATDEIVYDSYGEAIHSDIDPISTARYNRLSRITQRIVGKGAKSSSAYSLVKSGMLELEAKMDAFAISEEEQRRTSQKKASATNGDYISSSDEDILLGDTMKGCAGQWDSQVKGTLGNKEVNKSATSKQTGSKEGNVTIPQMISGTQNMHRRPQNSLGLPHHPSQMPPWYLPFNFMGPGQRYTPSHPQVSSVQTHVPQRPVGRPAGRTSGRLPTTSISPSTPPIPASSMS